MVALVQLPWKSGFPSGVRGTPRVGAALAPVAGAAAASTARAEGGSDGSHLIGSFRR